MIKVLDEWKVDINLYKCPYCDKRFSKRGIVSHIWRSHGEGINHSFPAWNKGLTKETDKRVKSISEKVKIAHKEGRLNSWNPRKDIPLSKNHKKNVSIGMKKAHEEGRAWNIGMNSWNGENSYPEKFFLEVINNEFVDKNVIEQLQFSKYKLDFAWEHKKKCIEIDGDQHTRFKNLMESDIRKDKLLLEKGWSVLRISWKDIYHDTKKWIKIAKDFIDE